MKCEYCGGDVEIRNPTGRCDHLYYPENVNKNFKRMTIMNKNLDEILDKYRADFCSSPYSENSIGMNKNEAKQEIQQLIQKLIDEAVEKERKRIIKRFKLPDLIVEKSGGEDE